MSGSCDNTDCPRCLGKGTLEVCSDWKPFDKTTGQCFRCGFVYYYKFEIEKDMSYLKEQVKEWENEEAKKECMRPFNKEELDRIKEFDEDYNIKVEKGVL